MAVAILGPAADEFVFLGGASIHVWITEPAAPIPRATVDVDVICAVASRPAFHRIEESLRKRGLRQGLGPIPEGLRSPALNF